LSLIVAFFLIPVPFPLWSENILAKIGDTLVPLALISVGYQLKFADFKGNLGKLTAGLIYKLVLGPLIITLLFVFILGAKSIGVKIAIFETAMAPMITGAIIAMENNLDAPLASVMLSVGIPLSFATAFLWYVVLKAI
jgi:predicted permease